MSLTDERIQEIWNIESGSLPGWKRHISFGRAIEAEVTKPVNGWVLQELEAERDALKEELSATQTGFLKRGETISALAMQVEKLREALELAAKTISDMETSGDLDTETIPILMEALALPDHSDIIKRHDAELIAAIRSVPCSNCGMVAKAAELEKS